MDRLMSKEELSALLDQVTREITQREAGICLSLAQAPRDGPCGDCCTAYITFGRGLDGTFCLRADEPMLVRLAQGMTRIDAPSHQDMEDAAKEYLNVLCGHVFSRLFRIAKRPARFSVPGASWESYVPEDGRQYIVLDYAGEQDERARLTHYVPCRGGE